MDALLGDEVDRTIRDVIRRTLGSHSGTRDAPSPEDLEDVQGEVIVLLLRKLHSLSTDANATPIADLRAYAATVAYHACYAYVRRRRPHWTRLKNQVRYVMTHDPELSLQQRNDDGVCVYAGPRTAAAAQELDRDAHTMPLRDLLKILLRQSPHPIEIDELVSAIAKLRGIHDLEATTSVHAHQEIESIPDSSPTSQTTQEDVEYLRRLWDQIRQLPLRQRTALLLNLRDARGEGLLSLLPLTRTASIRQIAEALELGAEELAALWKDLPLDDLRIADRLGLTRQQVINLRKSARERLGRRMALPLDSARGSNTPLVSASSPTAIVRTRKGVS